MPVKVWEPVPDLCSPAELRNLQRAAEWVKVVSPNGEEFLSFFVDQIPRPDRKAMVERVLGRKLGTGNVFPAFVIREGADGCHLLMGEQKIHFRAYHRTNARVVDPTGGGNTFLGALAIALTSEVVPQASLFAHLQWDVKSWMLDELMDFVCAVVHATIAASFAIEQVGMPRVEQDQPDIWNGQSYIGRFHEYLQREGPYLKHQLNQGRPPDDEQHDKNCNKTQVS